MTKTLIDYYWREPARELGLTDETAGSELQRIRDAYSNEKRHYHNIEHISAMLRSFEAYSDAIHDKKAVLLSIFYHDIVYNVPGPENEHQSALRAADFLHSISAEAALIHKVKQFIEATKQHESVGDTDLDYLLDFDLQILSAPSDIYHRYTAGIRKEYSIYPDLLYKPGRAKVLQHFLEQEHIFKTPAFRKQHEKQARENLSGELLAMLK